jgi:hypothetical protein
MEKILLTITKVIKHPAFQIAVTLATVALEIANHLEQEKDS